MSRPASDEIAARRAQAAAILHDAATEHGFVASRAFGHYDGIWTRDAGISALAVAAAPFPRGVAALRATVTNLARHRSETGMVPNTIWSARGYWDWGEAGSVDGQAWFLIMVQTLVDLEDDDALGAELWPAAMEVLRWLRMQDVTGFRLISAVGATDWMDSSLNRSGMILHDNVLYVRAIAAMERLGRRLGHVPEGPSSADIAHRVNLLFWPRDGADYGELLAHVGYPGGPHPFGHSASVRGWREAGAGLRHYLSHVSFATYARSCDVLGNLLAIIWGVAGPAQTASILDHLAEARVAEPFPSRTWTAPASPGDDPWDLYHRTGDLTQDERWRNPPNAYHNGASWPFIGGLHVVALVAAGRIAEAGELLTSLAAANAPEADGPGFPEWRDGATGAPGGAREQAWSAAGFVLACEALAGRGGVAG